MLINKLAIRRGDDKVRDEILERLQRPKSGVSSLSF